MKRELFSLVFGLYKGWFIMGNVYAMVRIRAGLYVSGDGQFRIRRRMDMLRRRWVWDIYHLDDGQYVLERTFRTLKVARQWVGKSESQPVFW